MSPAFALVLALAAADPAAASSSVSPCATPRQAAATFLANLAEDRMDARRGSRCAESPRDLSRAEKERRVGVLKETLDATGARVRIEEVPDTASYLDPKTYEPVYVLSSAVPRIRLERTDAGEWLIPAHVVEKADVIYDEAVAFDLHRVVARGPAWLRATFLGLAPWQLLAFLAMVALGWALGAVIIRLIAWKLEALVTALHLKVTRADLKRAAWPLTLFILAAVVWLGVPSLLLPARFAAGLVVLTKLCAAISVVALSYTAVDVLSLHFVARALETPQKMDDHIVPLVRRVLKIVIVLVGGIVVLQNLSVDVGSLIAGLGIGGLAVALAAKDTIGNFFGSIAIFLDRPFQIGDWIVSAHAEGTVEAVGFRSTQIRTIGDTVVTVPNAKLADDKIDNFGARKARRVKFTVALEHDTSPDQIEAFCDGVRAILNAYPYVDHERIEVHFNDLSGQSFDFLVHFYLVIPGWSSELRARHEILTDIVRLGRDMGVRLAYPTRTVDVPPAEKPEKPSRDQLLAVIQRYGPGGTAVIPPGARVLPPPPQEPAPAPQRPEDKHLREP
jgi:MscS family membrane protein